MYEPKVVLAKYADGSEAVLVEVPGHPAPYPVESCGSCGAEVLRRFRLHEELLAACKAFSEAMRTAEDVPAVVREAWDKAKDAIAKAEPEG